MAAAFANRVAFITGAGSGLGREMARLLAAQGAAVAALDLTGGPLEQLAAELVGTPFAWAVGDVTDLPGLRRAATDLEARVGPFDLLLASAGIGRETSALDFHAEDFEALVRVNLIGVANSIDAVLPGMLRRQRGQVVAISSLASYRGLPHMAGYCASKAGLNALLESLRVELRPHGIDVTTICPGWVRTPMTAPIKAPMPGLLEVTDAAARILEAVRRRRSFHAFPRASRRHVRLLHWLPARLSDWLIHRSWGKMKSQEARVGPQAPGEERK